MRTDSSGRRLTFAPPAERASALAGVTELGGLFYLVNVALFLELYGDFTTVNRGIALDPWDFVALVGSELLGGTDDDRAWGMLDELAARPGGTRAGHGFRAPRTWRLDSAWLEPFADDKRPWRAVTTGGRLRVLHPAAFAVLDLPPADDPAERLRRELRRYGEPRIAPVAHGAGNHRRPGRDRWVGWITDYVRARLALALGVAAPEVPDLLLRRRARVLASPARVDVVFRLDDLPIEIRLAGLDRDPGWVPAAGRHIALHFD